MLIRFFNDVDPADPQKERLLIGIGTPDLDRGQAREAVRRATEEDVALYPAAYAAYRASFEAAGQAEPPPPPPETETTGEAG